MTSENYIKRESGLIYRDFEVGKGDCPKAGQQVFLSFSFKVTASFPIMYLDLVIESTIQKMSATARVVAIFSEAI